MAIIPIHTDPKREDRDMTFFLSQFPESANKDIRYHAIPQSPPEKTPDYFVEDLDWLVEVKEIHDRETDAQFIRSHKNLSALTKAIEAHPDYGTLAGRYFISTPFVNELEKTKKNLAKLAGQLLAEIIAGNEEATFQEIKFEIKRFDGQPEVIFSPSSGAMLIDPAKTIFENLSSKIITANTQLGYKGIETGPKKRILLLVNHYYFADRIGEIIQALAYSYRDLLSCSNIDEIWYQDTQQQKDLRCQLYSQTFLNAYESGTLNPSASLVKHFEDWFIPLKRLGEDHFEKLILGLKHLLTDRNPADVFHAAYVREEMVQMGRVLIEKQRFQEALWLIDKFIADPDPPSIENIADPTANPLLKPIMDGDEVHIITSVLGHLAWLIKDLYHAESLIIPAFERTMKMAKHSNPYVLLEVIIPLISAVSVRGRLRRHDVAHGTTNLKQLHNSAFYLLRNYGKYPAFGKPLSHLFYSYQDVSSDEAIEILKVLEACSESSSLFVYFGIYRTQHFKDSDNPKVRNYDGESVNQKLREIIVSSEPRLQATRCSIAWQIWRLLKANPTEFETLKPYIDLFVSSGYDRQMDSYLINISEEHLGIHTEVALGWIDRILDQMVARISGNKGEDANMWLDAEDFLRTISEKRPEAVEGLILKLKTLRSAGIYVGQIDQFS